MYRDDHFRDACSCLEVIHGMHEPRVQSAKQQTRANLLHQHLHARWKTAGLQRTYNLFASQLLRTAF